MTEIRKFKIDQRFSGIEELYNYLFKNIAFIEEATGIKIQKPLKARPFCIIGQEKITERNIIFFASKSEFPDNLGELIVLADVFEADIVVFFMSDLNKNYLVGINWIQSICNDDTQFIVLEVSF